MREIIRAQMISENDPDYEPEQQTECGELVPINWE
jgi:hypothetical protein